MQNDSQHRLVEQERPAAPSRANVSTVDYIDQNYDPSDRLAIVIRNRLTGETTQRLATAHKIKSQEFQAWLRFKNAGGADIYISQNPLRAGARTRSKGDLDQIRHVYLDLDRNGDQALDRIRHSEQAPEPSYVIATSPHKYQVIWKVSGLTLVEAEALQRTMAAEFGGDPAATDSTRVLRLPGFKNKKYQNDYHVTAQAFNNTISTLADFRFAPDEHYSQGRAPAETADRGERNQEISQSERDWAYVWRHLARGELPERLIETIIHFRQDKSSPDYYARQTVSRAYASVALARGDSAQDIERRISRLATHQPNPEMYAKSTVAEMQAQKAADHDQVNAELRIR
ncbi:MAG: DNA-primase RepB domain-containing protein [Candidatus Acidiferrales bacterium]